MPRVTVLLPAHDEAGAIGDVVRRCVRTVEGQGEVLVVDDGSRDGTAKEAFAAGARVVRLPDNRGKGAAVRRGLAEARGEVIVLLDADGQDPPEEIPRLLEALSPDVDLVIGSRFRGRFEPGSVRAVDHAGNRALTAVVNALFRTRLTDTQAGFKAARRQTLLDADLEASTYDIEVEMLLAVLRDGGRAVEVPVTRLPRRGGRSKLRAVRDGSRILARILRSRLTR